MADEVYQVLRSAAVEVGERTRQSVGRVAGVEFRGVFGELFERSLAETGREAARLCEGLRALGYAVDDLVAAAGVENRRRCEVREWQVRQRVREELSAGVGQPVSAVVGLLTDPCPGPGVPAPVRTAPAVLVGRRELPRPGVAQGRGGKGLVSARPGELRAFVAAARCVDGELAGSLSRVRGALEDFEAGCRWGRLQGSGLVSSFRRWLDRNASDTVWLQTVVAGFEEAGSGAVPGGTVWAVFGTGRLAAPVAADLLDLLGGISAAELQGLLTTSPELLEAFWATPPDPVEVAAWWAGLAPAERTAFVALAPAVIGNLPGIPYRVRDTANRALYAEWATRKDLTPVQAATLEKLGIALQQTADFDGAPVLLVAFHLTAAVLMVAVGYGDPDTADTTTWCVPGMGFDASEATDSWSQAARNLLVAQRKLDPVRSHSVVSWLCYDTPVADLANLGQVLGPAHARAGARRLAAELDGNHAVRTATAPATPTIGVVAHSYGTPHRGERAHPGEHPGLLDHPDRRGGNRHRHRPRPDPAESRHHRR
ncbi:alpha/beta hydrolase [Leifsonia xyli]|uniref:alpha/beta hydrolase n=1 Tax=Leifsonia xyli TaxID=1575 RepID=UPI00178C763F|nr:alpha/beta hydrolase [Leifsonia xyli]